MKKLLVAVAVFLVLSLPMAAVSGPPPNRAMPPQGKAGPPGVPGLPNPVFDPSAMMMGLPAPMPFVQTTSLSARLEGRVGNLWLNQFVNFPITNLNRFLFEDMTVSLKDANLLMGMLGLDLEVGDRFPLYGQIGGSIPRNAKAVMSFNGIMNPLGGANTVSPWEWKVENLQWWMVDAGLGIRVAEAYAVVAGFRTEHLDYRMIDPRNNTFENRGPDSLQNFAIT